MLVLFSFTGFSTFLVALDHHKKSQNWHFNSRRRDGPVSNVNPCVLFKILFKRVMFRVRDGASFRVMDRVGLSMVLRPGVGLLLYVLT